MMLQVRNCKFFALCALLLLAAGCKDNSDPFVTPGNVANPEWTVSGENDMTSSMTAVVKVSFAESEGTLAAFMGDQCCGIAEYKADYGLYWLYISPANANANANVALRFYSPDLKRIFDATSTFPYSNDSQLGSVAEPYTPQWSVAK